MFDTSSQGLSLPSAMFTTFVPLIEFVSGTQVNSDSSSSQGFSVTAPCSSFSSTLNDYSFKVQFTSDTTNYVRVPLLTFAYDSTDISGAAVCNLMISKLDTKSANSDVVVFGGMFFEEFYGMFTNSYSSSTTMDQSSALFVGRNSIYSAYIGDEVLS